MPRISIATAESFSDLNGDRYNGVYYAKNTGRGDTQFKFRRENTGLWSSSSQYGNTIEQCLDSTKHNSLGSTGHIPLGDAWTPKNLITGLGRFFIRNTNEHQWTRSAVYEFSNRMKVCNSSQKYGLKKNTAVRYFPNKKNPRLVDIYPFKIQQLVYQKNIVGSFAKALKIDMNKEVSNALASYLGRKEEVYMDEDGELKYFSNHQIAIPPELTEETSFQNNVPHDVNFRRKLANFMFFGVNQKKTYFEKDDNAENLWLQTQLKNNHEYELVDVVENTYTEEKLFQPLLEKYFQNVVVIDDNTIDFEHKGIKYTLKGDTFYNENNEEVIGLELDDGTIFTFNYEKYIVEHIKDNAEVKDYIDRFKSYIKTQTKRDFNDLYYMYDYWNRTRYYDQKTGATGDTEASIKTDSTGSDDIQPYSCTTLENQKQLVFYDTNQYGTNYQIHNNNIQILNGKYNSANIFPLSQLVSLNTAYNDTLQLVLNNEKLSTTADETTGETSYENAYKTPIMIKNWLNITYDVYKTSETPGGDGGDGSH